MFVIDRQICACCHNCANDCPMQAIDFVGTKYQIDQEKCVQCGLCAKVCHTGACHEEPRTPVVAQTHDPITLDCDVVVVGSGSGFVPAVRAAEAGKKVIMLEKSSKLGGNTDFAHGYMVAYSKWHEKLGISDAREGAVESFYERGDGEIEKELIRSAVYGACDFFDWLCDHCDITKTYKLKKASDTDFHGPMFGDGILEMPDRQFENLLCRDDAIGPGWGGTHVKRTMLDAIENKNLPVKILTSTAAEHLQLDEDGKICGVIARDPGGEVHIRCKTVMLCCGGFGRNDDLLRKYADFDFFGGETPIHRFSVPGDTGDGITMLQELGVEPNPARMTVSMFGPKHHPFNNSIADFALEPEFIQVNLNGRRWVDETKGIMNGMSQLISDQPKEISYAIFPYDQIKACAERYVKNPAVANKAHFYATWEEDLEEESKLDTPVKKADTLEELAVLMGADPAAFLDEIKKYNGFCEKGVDEDFGKDPRFLIPIPLDKGPYYAVYGQRFSEAAMGGVTVNPKCQVLRNDGSIIPGLYAGGDCTSAMHRKGKLAPVSELTWAMASGFIGGSNMVAYIDGKEE
ncbi:MAG: FAD-binding protein, partial [Oscillospiraceae bacterium]|nr:FAD-binding protein [Oscillospiraceae bacterium]